MNPFKFFGSGLCLAILLGSASPVTPQSGNPQSSAPQWSETQSQSDYRDPYAGWWRGALEGYADKSSAKQGETIAFKVSVYKPDLQPGTYTVEIYRVGASPTSDQLMTSLGSFTSPFKPLHDKTGILIYPGDYNHFPVEHRTGCDVYNWPIAFQLTVPLTWPSGFYYAKLILSSDPTKFGRIPFVVKEDSPGSTSKILCVIAWNTYQAYNYWGGGSLYWWTGTYDSTAKAYIDTVSFKRPFGLHHHWDEPGVSEEHRYKFVDQLGQLHHRERQFINWAESNGDTMEYCIDLDVHDPTQGLALLSNYKMVVFPGHSEYWSRSQRINTKNFLAGGGNLAFFAANSCYWQVDFHNGNSKIYCMKPSNQYWWRRDPQEGPESKLIGIMFGGLVVLKETGSQTANTVMNAAHWLFSGTGLSNGASIGFGLYNSQPDLNIDPLVAGEADMRPKAIYMPPNVEVLARRYVRNLFSMDEDSLHGGHYDDPRFPFNPQESNQLYSEVTYYEDTGSNARVFAAGAHGWCNSLYGTDGNTMGIITQNILDHFSFKKYRGNIYTNLEWGNDPLETSTILDGDTYILSGKTLSLTNGFTLTINPGVTLYVQGTLSLASNVTITGGGTVVIQGSGKILASNSVEATAFNNSRKIARDASGNYYVVFETEGEICYEKLNSSTALTKFQRLSSGNGNNKYPCIAERGGKLYVVWQRYDGSSYDVYFRKSTDGGASWATTTELAPNTGNLPAVPVIISPATSTLMVVYRNRATNKLRYKVSTNDGSSWTTGDVPFTGTYNNYPSLAATTAYWGSPRSALVFESASNSIHYRYYRHDSTNWAVTTTNLAQIVPGSYNSHQKPSITPSGTSGDKRLHVVWEARSGTSGNYYVIIHRKATDWATWPSVYSATYYEQQKLPSITGLANDTAELLFQYYTQNQIYKMHYNGSSWGAPVFISTGMNPSASVANTSAKYVWTDGTTSPYQVKTSTETLSKTSSLTVAYHRSIAVIDTTTSAWLEIRIDKLSVKTKSGSEFAIPFENAKEDDATLTPANAFINLSSPSVLLPADAESLLVSCQVSGQGLSAIEEASSTIAADIILTGKDGATLGLPAFRATSENLTETKLMLSASISAFAGNEISLRTQVSGVANKSSLIASLGHIYEFVEEAEPQTLATNAEITIPREFSLTVNPNPFNPSTQIHFFLPSESQVTLRIYNISGQMVRELFHEQQHAAGEHTVLWDGRDGLGRTAASGVYFIRFENGSHMKVSKLTLVR